MVMAISFIGYVTFTRHILVRKLKMALDLERIL
jgi:hypothetical protein